MRSIRGMVAAEEFSPDDSDAEYSQLLFVASSVSGDNQTQLQRVKFTGEVGPHTLLSSEGTPRQLFACRDDSAIHPSAIRFLKQDDFDSTSPLYKYPKLREEYEKRIIAKISGETASNPPKWHKFTMQHEEDKTTDGKKVRVYVLK